MIKLKNIILFAFLLTLGACHYYKETDLVNTCDAANAKYSTAIAPMMQTYCNGCHSGASPSAGIATDNYASLKIIALNGALYGCMSHTGTYSAMPKGGNKLDSCSLATIKVWVDAGAPQN